MAEKLFKVKVNESFDLGTDFSKGFSHHGTKGMEWGVWNEETKQKYGVGVSPTRTKNLGGAAESGKDDDKKTEQHDTDSIANDVIRGDYGNGQERVDRLTSAGYDYDVVQNRVNEIIYGVEPTPKKEEPTPKKEDKQEWKDVPERKKKLVG